jgi:hypothetical protein
MSGIVIPGMRQRRSIALQTRESWDVPNSQSFETSLWDEHQLEDHRQRHRRAVFRTGAIPVYNCHGLTFAARRSGVWETAAIQRILQDDRYEQVSREEAQAGDIILYVSAESTFVRPKGMEQMGLRSRSGPFRE